MGLLDGIEPVKHNKKSGLLDGIEPIGSNGGLLGGIEPVKPKSKGLLDGIEPVNHKPDQYGRARSFLSGGYQNYTEYAASINKGLDWAADKITGRDTKFFEDNAGFWNKERRESEAHTKDHNYYALGGKMLLDPVNVMPAGIVAKGTKAARIGKSMAAGAGIGAGIGVAKTYGNEDKTAKEKAGEIAGGAAVASVLNGIIAAVTKGKVTNAIKDATDLTDPKPQTEELLNGVMNTEEGRAHIEAVLNNPEKFGLINDADKAMIQNLSAMKWSKASQKEASKMYSVLHNDKAGTRVQSPDGDIHVTKEFAEKMHKKHLDDPEMRGMVTTEEAISFPKVVRNTENVADNMGRTWKAQADDGNEIIYGSRDWGEGEKLLTIHSKTGHGGRANSTAIETPIFNDQSNGSIPQTSNEVNFDDPLVAHVIERAKDRASTQTRYDKIRTADQHMRYTHDGKEWETQISPATYTNNPEFDFVLTKADYKKIQNGKITPEIVEKIKQDVSTMENHPDWIDEAEHIRKGANKGWEPEVNKNGELLDANGNVLFANGAGNTFGGAMGGGFLGGADAAYDDIVGGKDLTTEDYLKRIGIGAAAGAGLGYKFGGKGEGLGVFAGRKAKGFEAATNKHKGKYDGFDRFEIDDSKFSMIAHKNGSYKLSDVVKHDELLNNYPELKDVTVTFTEMPNASHGYFNKDRMELVLNSTKSKDDLESTALHEIQHWIQGKEGFAGGGSYHDKLREVEGRIYDLEKRGELSPLDAMNYREEINKLKNSKEDIAFDKYQKIAGEIEAREVQARQHLTPEERNIIPPYHNSSTLADGSPEAYNAAFMGELDGRLKDFNSAGIAPEDATLDFSRSFAESRAGGNSKGFLDNNTDELERLAKEREKKGFSDISQDNGTRTNITNKLKEYFTDTFSGSYHSERQKVHTNLQAKEAEIIKLTNVLDTIDEKTDKALYQYLTKTGDGKDIPKEIKELGDKIRNTIDGLGEQLVNDGVLTKKAYDEWAGAYLHRNYEKHLTTKKGIRQMFKIDKIHERGLSGKFKSSDLEKAKGWLIENGYLDEGKMLNFNSMDDLVKHLNDSGKTGLLREGKLSIEKTADGYKFRRDFTKSEREAMGEIESAKYSVPDTLMRLYRMKEHSDFLKRINQVDGVVADSEFVKHASPVELDKAGFTKLDTSPQYGILSGKWVRKDVADDIGRSFKDISDGYSDLHRAWNNYHGLWKKSKTVWNPTAHLNNFSGNLFLMQLSGIRSHNMPKMLKEGADQMKSLKRLEELETKQVLGKITEQEAAELPKLQQQAKYALEGKQFGIFGKSQLNDILSGMEQTVTKKKGMLGKVDEFASKAYQFEDDFNRLSFYITLRQSGKDPKTAKQMVDFMLPDYTKPLPKGWRALRDTSVAPFISWSYYTMPSIVRMLGTKEGAKNAAKVMGLLSAIEYATSGGEVTPTDNLPFVDGNKPEDFKGRRFVIGKDGDTMTTIKMDRVIPYAELQNPINYGRSMMSGMLPNAFASFFMGRKLYNGRPVTYDNKSAGDQAIDWTKHIMSQFTPAPTPVMNGVNLIDSVVRPSKYRKRNNVVLPRTPVEETLKNLGINTMSYSKRNLKKEQKKKR